VWIASNVFKFYKKFFLNYFIKISIFFFILTVNLAYSQVVSKVFIKFIIVENSTVIPKKEINKIISPYENKYLTFKEIKNIASKITELYIEKGYITSRAYVPPQDLSKGIFHINVLEGKTGQIIIQGEHPFYTKNYILKFLKPLKEEKVFNKKLLERALLLLNDSKKLKVTANLKKGKTPGTTDIILKVKSSFPFDATITYDNWGSKYTSRDRYGLNFSLGNVIIEGSTLGLAEIRGSSESKLRSYSISYNFPIGVKGWKMGFWYAAGDSNLGKELAVLNIKSYSRFLGFLISYPLIKSVNKELTIQGSFNALYSRQTMLNQTTAEDRIRYIQVELDYRRNKVTSQNLAQFSITQGLGTLFGGMSKSQYSSRYNASNTFTKFNFSFIRVQRLSNNFFLLLKFNSQYSDDILYSSQNFYIGGPISLRGFMLTQYGGDSGYSFSSEIRWAPFKHKDLFQLLGFWDTGTVFLNHPYKGQERQRSLTGAGFGIRLNLPLDFSFLMDVGYPIHPDTDGKERHVNVYIKITKQF